MTINPIFCRELIAGARKGRLQSDRSTFAGILLAIVLGTFWAWYYWENGHVSQHLMARVAQQSFLWLVATHALLILGIATVGALSIAGEKDRRTLDFLVATPLSNSDIVLGKLASCLVFFFTSFAVGLPVMLLLDPLGGIDLRLILLAYAGLATTAFFVLSLSIWISTGAPDGRSAAGTTVLSIVAWLVVPALTALVLPRFGLRLPGFVSTVNAWVLASSPLGFVLKFAGAGLTASSALIDAVAWMGGLQLLAGVVLLFGSIARIRSAYRVNVGGDGHALGRKLKRPAWRLRPRPAVGDDPILWREMYTSRGGLIMKLLGLLLFGGIYGALGYATLFFGSRAFVELWRHGYASGVTSAERPEFNLMIRFFFSDPGVNAPVDLARTEFNLFLRSITTSFMFFIGLLSAGLAVEAIATERAKETWNSLIATPLSPREILRSKMLACLWRLRVIAMTLVVLWTIGLIAGAIHPLGYIVTLLDLAATTWFLLAFGVLTSLRSNDLATASNKCLSLVFLPMVSTALPFLLPARMSSVILGAGSPPFVAWLSLVSYRDVRAALHYPVYPHLQWINIHTGQGPLPVMAACLIGILAPAIGGLLIWRYSVAHFDRLIGRPWKNGLGSSNQTTAIGR